MWQLITKIFVTMPVMQKTDNIYISIFDYLCYCYLESLSTVTEENVVLMEKKKTERLQYISLYVVFVGNLRLN